VHGLLHPNDALRAPFVYNASKTEGEMAVLKFAAEKNPHFSVNSVDPSTIMGESLNKKHHETFYAYIKQLCDGNTQFLAGIPSSKSFPSLIDNQKTEMLLAYRYFRHLFWGLANLVL
jgi:hypothetical protein